MTSAAFAELCPGCLTAKGTASICPHCGYDESLKRGPLVLPHRALLHQGQYLIGKVLGKPGGFGITYLALDTRLETKVAIKEYLPRDLAGRDGGHATISAHSAEDGEFFRYGLTQFLQEARTLAKFDHANIVRVRNFFEENGTGYLVMDYYDGITLADYLAQQPQGKLPEKTAIGILMPILDGLREVHAKNFLHRDIKPQNIYLTTGNRPILLDFGAARQAMGERSRSISVVLSEGYAPYEQYHRRGEQGPWTDIYACAAVLYHAVAGEAPPPATERVHKDELDIAALGISASLAEALRLGLAVDHNKRPQRMTEFQALLLGTGEIGGVEEEAQKPKKVDLSAPSAKKQTLEPAQSKGIPSKKTGWVVALAAVVVMAMVTMFTKEEKGKVPTVEVPASVATETRAEPVQPAPVAPVAEAEIKPDKVLPPASVDSATSGSEAAEATLWKSVENSTSKDDYDSYLKQYPKGKYVALAKNRIKKLQSEAAARQAETQRVEAEQQAAKVVRHEQEVKEANTVAKISALLIRSMRLLHLGKYSETMKLNREASGLIDAESLGWLRKAADQGNVEVQCALGYMYANGFGVVADGIESERWWRKSADQGNALAQVMIGVMYKLGKSGVTKDKAEAIRWFRKAAEQGNAAAQHELAGGYATGDGGVDKDFAEMARWERKAAEQGLAGAQYALGFIYLRGAGVTKDEAEAIRWWRKAAEQGNVKAKTELQKLGLQ